MKVESVNITGGSPMTLPRAADKVEAARKEKDNPSKGAEAVEKQQIAPEELLGQIKSLTEDGLFSVRFENDETANSLVVKIVDLETDEVIRQVPAEEILDLRATLEELTGNIVNTKG